MLSAQQQWLRGLRSSSLFRPPPQDANQWQSEVSAYVDLFGQFASESFVEEIGELVRTHYPHNEACLLDDVLARFVLHHPEHGHAILHPLLSCIIDGTLIYNKKTHPFDSFVSLFSPSSERDFTAQWVLACGEILRVLTHYNRPLYNLQHDTEDKKESASHDTSDTDLLEGKNTGENGKKTSKRLLSSWITDSLLAAPLGTRSDYFRWCGGVVGKYATGGELRPPTTAIAGKGQGKHPQLLSSTPRWAVANGAAVILSVCDDEVMRYETAELTAAAVPALLLPPPAAILDDHLVAGLPPLEPYARLFHRYYSIATPGATQRLLLGLLEAPPSWAPDALDAAVQLVELLRAAEDFSSSFKLPGTWFHLHFLRPVGAAMAMKSGVPADAAAALLFRIFSQPALLFPPRGSGPGIQVMKPLYGPSVLATSDEEMGAAAIQANEEATAKGVASLMYEHGPDVEWRICALWEAAYGLLPLNSSMVNLPELVVASPLQPPILSWSLFRPLLRVLEHLPHGSPSQACLRKIFSATVNAVLLRTFPVEEVKEQKNGSFQGSQSRGNGKASESIGLSELRALVHCLFSENLVSPDLAAQLLCDALTVCLSHDTLWQSEHRKEKNGITAEKESHKRSIHDTGKERGAVATFDSYVIAVVCALACELQLYSFSAHTYENSSNTRADIKSNSSGSGNTDGTLASTYRTKRLLVILENLLTLKTYSADTKPFRNGSSSDIVAAAVVAAHILRLLGKSRACMHAMTTLTRSKLDMEISKRACSVLSLVEGNGKAIMAVIDSHNECQKKLHAGELDPRLVSSSNSMNTDLPLAVESPSKNEGTSISSNQKKAFRVKQFTSLSMNAADLTNILCDPNGLNKNVSILLKKVLKGKQDLAVAAVPLLWQRLVATEEVPISSEGTSAKQGWRQVVEALCNVVIAFPARAAPAVLLQAKRELRPWSSQGHDAGRVSTLQLNTRIICFLSELLRIPNNSEVLKAIVDDSEILYRATSGMFVNGQLCMLPQLELLEAAAAAAQSLLPWNGDVGRENPAEILLALLKARFPAMVRCLAHDNARIRSISTVLLQDVIRLSDRIEEQSKNRNEEQSKHRDWRRDLEQCLQWEVHYRLASGLSISLLVNAASTLGCQIPC